MFGTGLNCNTLALCIQFVQIEIYANSKSRNYCSRIFVLHQLLHLACPSKWCHSGQPGIGWVERSSGLSLPRLAGSPLDSSKRRGTENGNFAWNDSLPRKSRFHKLHYASGHQSAVEEDQSGSNAGRGLEEDQWSQLQIRQHTW